MLGDMSTTDYLRIEQAIAFLEANFRRQPSLKEVAQSVHLSEFHFQRLFQRWAGISPKRFLQYLTAEHVKALLVESRRQPGFNLLHASYAAGLSGGGRLHDLLVNLHAITPGELKSEGAGLTIRYGVHHSPFGPCLLAITERGVCALSFIAPQEQETALAELQAQWKHARLQRAPSATREYIDRIFFPPDGAKRPPLCVQVKGTNFQVKVWEALLRIPAGALACYEDIAAGVGAPQATRAVGNAVGRNPVAFLIPCHRVIQKTGAFGGYRWGPTRKKAMLAWELAQLKGESA